MRKKLKELDTVARDLILEHRSKIFTWTLNEKERDAREKVPMMNIRGNNANTTHTRKKHLCFIFGPFRHLCFVRDPLPPLRPYVPTSKSTWVPPAWFLRLFLLLGITSLSVSSCLLNTFFFKVWVHVGSSVFPPKNASHVRPNSCEQC